MLHFAFIWLRKSQGSLKKDVCGNHDILWQSSFKCGQFSHVIVECMLFYCLIFEPFIKSIFKYVLFDENKKGR